MYYTTAIGLKAKTLKELKELISLSIHRDRYNGHEVQKVHDDCHTLIGYVDIKFHPSTMKFSIHISATRNYMPR